MRLLFVADHCPWPPTNGARLRNHHLIDTLSRTHRVRTVVLDDPDPGATLPPGVEVVPVGRLAADKPPAGRWAAVRTAVGRADPEVVRAIDRPAVRDALRGLRPLAADADAVWVSLPQYARLVLDAGWGRPVVADYYDITAHMERDHLRTLPWSPYRLLATADLAKLYRFERRLVGRLAAAAVCSEADRRFFGRRRGRVHVVPNGTAVRPALPAADEHPGQVLFVGVMSYHPNQEGVLWFLRECLPELRRAGAGPAVDVVGANPPPAVTALDDGDRVRVRGFAPDLADYYRRAAVVIAPVRLGGGTKLKVLEALAYGKAVVATPEAAYGLDLRPGVDLEVARGPAAFAAAVARLLADPAARGRLGAAGRERVLALYSWDRVGEAAARLLAGLPGRGAP